MTNSEQAIKEFAIKWGKQCLDMMVGQECIIDDSEAMLSDLTALISEHYVAKEEVEKMVSERLREETYMKCDVCGCHPSVIITTSFGKFCQQHAKYV